MALQCITNRKYAYRAEKIHLDEGITHQPTQIQPFWHVKHLH